MPRDGVSYLLASEITLLVASASCWHLIFSAVAFSKADVRLLRLALSSWENTERPRRGAAWGVPAPVGASAAGPTAAQ